MRKLIILGVLILASAIDAQDSKLSYNAMIGIQNKKVAGFAFAAYDLFEVQDVFGQKGMSLRARTLGGVPMIGRLTISGGADICLAGKIGTNAEGTVGLGIGFVEGQQNVYGVTLGVKIFTQPTRHALYNWAKL